MQPKPVIVARELPDIQDGLFADLHPVLRRIYLGRQVTDSQQTQNTLRHLLPFEQLKGIEAAVALLASHLQQQHRILIVGDYDADGATSCALAIRALRAMGALHVDFLVPNRFEYGYGLTPEIVEVAKQKQPNVIVTVDNGIASIEGVKVARAAGIQVIITDHHLPGNHLPDADAIVNPNQPGDHFPSKHLAGVGVMFYVIAALRAHLRAKNWFTTQGIAEPNLAEFLDLVALGTVADVVKLDHNNRILVAQGVARMRAGQACAGIRALIKVSGRDEQKLTSTDLGFFLGPRLNAAGRLDDMSIGIACLLSDDPQLAFEKAQTLDKFNRERRSIEASMREQARAHLQKLHLDNDSQLPTAVCLFDPEFHEGVIGILAGRIKEQTHRPTIVFAQTQDEMIKGSARSIPGLHIRDALDRVATLHPDLLTKFGGHAMAAGLTLRRRDFEDFNRIFNDIVSGMIDDDTLQRVIHIDGELEPQDISLSLAEAIRTAGPWGQGFPEPQFAGKFTLIQKRIVGEHHLKMVLRTENQQLIDAIAFQTTDQSWPEQVESVELVYKLDVNDFNGKRTAQLVVEYIEPVV
jgi:single-stranded-DNA-specific exonuclease